MNDEDKRVPDSPPNINEEKDKIEAQEHREWVKQEFEEAKYEKKKVAGFQKKIKKGLDLRKRAMFGGKFTHGTRGKPTHGPRGNQG